jgi:hypothetical protein
LTEHVDGEELEGDLAGEEDEGGQGVGQEQDTGGQGHSQEQQDAGGQDRSQMENNPEDEVPATRGSNYISVCCHILSQFYLLRKNGVSFVIFKQSIKNKTESTKIHDKFATA